MGIQGYISADVTEIILTVPASGLCELQARTGPDDCGQAVQAAHAGHKHELCSTIGHGRLAALAGCFGRLSCGAARSWQVPPSARSLGRFEEVEQDAKLGLDLDQLTSVPSFVQSEPAIVAIRKGNAQAQGLGLTSALKV